MPVTGPSIRGLQWDGGFSSASYKSIVELVGGDAEFSKMGDKILITKATHFPEVVEIYDYVFVDLHGRLHVRPANVFNLLYEPDVTYRRLEA